MARLLLHPRTFILPFGVLGMVVPISKEIMREWARNALNPSTRIPNKPFSGWWPTRSLAVRWLADRSDPNSAGKPYYYKANDEGDFDIAMPINIDPRFTPEKYWKGERMHVARFKKGVYCEPPDGAGRLALLLVDMELACHEVINEAVADMVEPGKSLCHHLLMLRKRTHIEAENRFYEHLRGRRNNRVQEFQNVNDEYKTIFLQVLMIQNPERRGLGVWNDWGEDGEYDDNMMSAESEYVDGVWL